MNKRRRRMTIAELYYGTRERQGPALDQLPPKRLDAPVAEMLPGGCVLVWLNRIRERRGFRPATRTVLPGTVEPMPERRA